VIVYAGAAISYKAKYNQLLLQFPLKQNSYTAKAVKHLCSILNDLGLLSPKATIIYEDNKAMINMINNSKLTA